MAEGDAEDTSGALEARGTPGGAESALVPVVIRKTVVQRSNYRDYRDDLREDFLFSCSYCSITETEAQGVGFNIDHYLPQEHHSQLVSEYTNLMWSCERCNETKSDYPEAGRDVGDFRVIKADVENPRHHLVLEEQSEALTHRTTTGDFNIRFLRLNRLALLRLRAARRRLSSSNAFIAHGISELLNVSLDAVDRQHRPLVHKLQRGLEREHQRATRSVRQLIEAAARSELLDVEPNRQRELAARRDYLRSLGAVGPGLITVPKAKPRQGKTRKTKSRRASKSRRKR